VALGPETKIVPGRAVFDEFGAAFSLGLLSWARDRRETRAWMGHFFVMVSRDALMIDDAAT